MIYSVPIINHSYKKGLLRSISLKYIASTTQDYPQIWDVQIMYNLMIITNNIYYIT